MTKKKKEQIIVEPKIIKQESNIKKNDFKDIISTIDKSNIIKEEKEDTDSYFRAIIDKLFGKDNIELKTDYLNISENFTGVKLQFLGDFGSNPLLSKFLAIFERKRVSLERKSRIEIIRALEHRREELERIQQEKVKNMLGF